MTKKQRKIWEHSLLNVANHGPSLSNPPKTSLLHTGGANVSPLVVVPQPKHKGQR